MADDLGLVERICVACGGLDTDPKHIIAMPDNSEVAFHMDCHSRVSLGYWGDGPCPYCIESLKNFDGEGGTALREHLIGAN